VIAGSANARPVKHIYGVYLDPAADIIPYMTPHPPDPFIVLTDVHRVLSVDYERTNPGICRAVEQLLELADPDYPAKAENFVRALSFDIHGSMDGLQGMIDSVSISICPSDYVLTL
jgi:hypothetical protein